MRFVFTAPRYHTNQHFAMKGLLDAGHEVRFLALGRGQSEVYDALHPMILGQSSILPVSPLFSLWRAMHRLKPDAVVVRNPNSPYGFLSVAVARLMGRTVIFYTQTPLHRQLGWRRRLMRSLPAWFVNAKWITPVLGDPERYAPSFGALRYVPFVMEPQTEPRQKRWFRECAINVLSVGKLEARKNHRLFLRAFGVLSERHRVRATVIGECTTAEHRREFAEIQELHRSLGLEGRVCFRTNLTYGDVQREYPEHDLFVLPSRDEPAAVSHLEAMSHSLPVICSDSNGTQCYIRQGENGYVFKTDDLDDLVDCMEHVVSDRRRLTEMGARSYDLVVSDHSPEKYVEKMVAIVSGNE